MINVPCLASPAQVISETILVCRQPVKVAALHDEEWLEGEPIADPQTVAALIRTKQPGIDVFSFALPLPQSAVQFAFHYDWDNVAVAELSAGFNPWWDSLPQETRKNVRRSQRRGVTVQTVSFSDDLVRGISRIYDETPIRQGRKFWHYRKSLDQVKRENSSYLDRSEFIGAFFEGQLIGFIKMVRVNRLYRIMQIVCLDAHTDKRPTNALLAFAIQRVCEQKGTHLIYGKFVYGTKENSPVTEFKRRNGFERLQFPRYYIPLTGWGALAIRCRLHRGWKSAIPEPIINVFLSIRASIYRRRFKTE